MSGHVFPLDPRLNAYRDDLADLALQDQVSCSCYVEAVHYIIHTPTAPIHEAPKKSAMMISQGLMGEIVKVFEQRDGWCWGQLAVDGYVGYFPSQMLTLMEDAQIPDHRIHVPRTFVYPHADLHLTPICTLSMACQLKILGQQVIRNTTYAQVQLPDGCEGAVIASHIHPLNAPMSDWVAMAEALLHTPYLWGGRSGFGLDCSGLVQLARLMANLKTLRDSDMQAKHGEPLAISPDLSGLCRGDLVFWPGHVGIMLDEIRLLHANGHHMAVAAEPLQYAQARIAEHYGPMTGARRL